MEGEHSGCPLRGDPIRLLHPSCSRLAEAFNPAGAERRRLASEVVERMGGKAITLGYNR